VGEHETDVCCVAAPVRDHSGKTIAAISVAGPAQRMEVQMGRGLIKDVVAAANRICRDLGYWRCTAVQEDGSERTTVEGGIREMSDLDVLVNALNSGRVSRREFVTRGIALGLSTSALGSLLAACAQTAQKPGGPVDLTFVTWSYGIDTIKSNIAQVRIAKPEYHREVQDFSWLTTTTLW